ncbi:unnamed protein product, partial [marine sediment metagenome]
MKIDELKTTWKMLNAQHIDYEDYDGNKNIDEALQKAMIAIESFLEKYGV